MIEVAILHVVVKDSRRSCQLLVTGEFQAPALKDERCNAFNDKGEHQNNAQIERQLRSLRITKSIRENSQIAGNFRAHRNIHDGKNSSNTDHLHQRQNEQADQVKDK